MGCWWRWSSRREIRPAPLRGRTGTAGMLPGSAGADDGSSGGVARRGGAVMGSGGACPDASEACPDAFGHSEGPDGAGADRAEAIGGGAEGGREHVAVGVRRSERTSVPPKRLCVSKGQTYSEM